MDIFLILGILAAVAWLVMWNLQYYYAKRSSLAQYAILKDEAWDRGDLFVHGVLGLFMAPIFLILVALEYRKDKDKISNFWKNKEAEKKMPKSESPTDKAKAAFASEVTEKYHNLLIKHSALEHEHKKLLAKVMMLESENEKLKELVKSISRFDYMDIE
jgi:hypothetical protein